MLHHFNLVLICRYYRLYDCISKMTGGRLNPYWVISWKFVGPVIFIVSGWYCLAPYLATHCLQFLIIMQVGSHTTLQYGLYLFPGWADGLGFLLVIFTLLWIPAYPLYYVLRIMVCTDQPGTPMQVRCHHSSSSHPVIESHGLTLGYPIIQS